MNGAGKGKMGESVEEWKGKREGSGGNEREKGRKALEGIENSGRTGSITSRGG